MSTLKELAQQIKTEKDTKIIPNNIKKDVQIFDILGALEGGGGSGDVKLFETIAQMQADSDPHEGDKALVYRSEIQSVEENSIFNSCTFPSTVTLDTAFTGHACGSFCSVDPNVFEFDASADVSPSEFSFQGYGDEEIQIEYSSSDGITYTRTDGGDETIDFSTDIKFDAMMEPWDDIFGQFMKIGGNHFEGLFEYKNVQDYNQIKYIDEVSFENNTLTYSYNKYLDITPYKNVIQEQAEAFFENENQLTLVKDADNIIIYLSKTTEGNDARSDVFLYDGVLYVGLMTNISNLQNFIVRKIVINSDGTIVSSVDLTYQGLNNNASYVDTMPNTIGYILIRSSDCQAIQTDINNITSSGDWTGKSENPDYKWVYKYVMTKNQLNATPKYVYEKEFLGKNGVEQGALATNTTNNFEDVDAEAYAKIQDYYDTLEPLVLTNSNVDEEFKYKYRKAKVLPTRSDGTQFLNVDALSSVAGLFYDFSNLRTIPNLNTGHMNDFSTMLSSCQSLTHIPNIDTSNATNMLSMFGYCHNLKSIPNLNTSKVTTMFGMFQNCQNLTTIPNLDTSNVTNMSYMFFGCMNLINIPNLNTAKTTKFDHMFENCQNFDFNNMSNFNTSNASSVTYMFQNCINMTDAPMIDTSNVIDIEAIYYDCYGLVNVPALNTAKARDFNYCFCDCYNLVNIPVWNTSNIVDMRNCFVNCINLSNQSLDNILSMCASATKITNSARKKLSYINLTQDQANICKNLPNYSAFTSAGWSTGY